MDARKHFTRWGLAILLVFLLGTLSAAHYVRTGQTVWGLFWIYALVGAVPAMMWMALPGAHSLERYSAPAAAGLVISLCTAGASFLIYR